MNPTTNTRGGQERLPGNDSMDDTCRRYMRRCLEGASIVVLDPDMAAIFPDSAAVNRALRKLLATVALSLAAGEENNAG
jgi:hypothetical protein